MLTQHRFPLLLLLFCSLSACSDTDTAIQPPAEEHLTDTTVSARVAKWFDDHAAAISVTYDSGWPAGPTDAKVQMLARGYGVAVDYEMVTDGYRTTPELSAYLRNVMIPLGIGVFGHGDLHVNHDSMTYQQAYQSFKRCYDTMRDFGLNPVAYAYPGGWGYEEETQRALADAGFLSGRRFSGSDYRNPYITPDTVREPDNWYQLPSLIMEEYHIAQCEECVSSPAELGTYLDEAIHRTAWIITTYHVIYDWGQPQGYYRMGEFERDLQEIARRDVWSASFNAATLYIMERNRAQVQAVWQVNEHREPKAVQIALGDNLPNDRYTQPLTVVVDLPATWVGKTLGIYKGTTLIGTMQPDAVAARVSLVPAETTYRLRPL